VAGARFVERVRYPLGTAQNPMSPAQVWDKFTRNTSPVIGAEATTKLAGLLGALTDLTDLGEITGLTVA
jgi:hypothetical protein